MRTHRMQIQKYSASKLHAIGGKLREEDNLEGSLVYETLALAKFVKNKDYENVVDTLQARFLTWKHLFLFTGDKVYLELAIKDAQASLIIAEKLELKDIYSKCYFRMGEVCMLKKNYNDAIKFYTKALNSYEGSLSEKGDYRYHLGEAMYRSNNKEKGYQTMLKGLSEIEEGKNRVDRFLFNIWKSGCLLRLAELLKKDNPLKARSYLKIAGEIIKSDPRLIIRKRQFEKLE